MFTGTPYNQQSSKGFMYDVLIGVDPGTTGAASGVSKSGLFLFSTDTPVVVTPTTVKRKGGQLKTRTSVDYYKLAELVADWKTQYGNILLVVEKVQPMGQEGAWASWTFSASYHCWLSTAACFKVPIELVSPTVWKKHMFSGTANSTVTNKDKNKSAAQQASLLRAKQLYPTAAGLLTRLRDDGRAESLLLAEYARRQFLAGGVLS